VDYLHWQFHLRLKIWIETTPLKQWMTARELRRRLKIAFDCHNIQIGIPQQVLLDNSFDRVGTIEQSPAIEEDSN
jgi:moderate conductance mechanosensitive channel